MTPRRTPHSRTEPDAAGAQSTRERLLDVTVGLIDSHGEWGVKLDDVLALSDASASSVYHHFGNLRGLVEEAQVRRFIEARFFDVLEFAEGVSTVSSTAEFRDVVESYLHGMLAESRVSERARRLSALASSQHNAKMRARLAALERESLDGVITGLSGLQARGIIAADIDVVAVAALASGLLFSRSLTELIGDADVQARWDAEVIRAVRTALGLDR